MKKVISLFLILVFGFYSLVGTAFAGSAAQAANEVQTQNKLKSYGFKNVKYSKNTKRSQVTAQKRHKNKDYEIIATMDEATKDIVLEVYNPEKKAKEVYKVDVHEADGDLLVATFTNQATGEKFEVNNTKATSNFAFVVPIGIVVGEALVSYLVAASLGIVVAGVVYVAASKVAAKLRKEKRYEHYAASLNKSKTNLYIGPALTYKQAMTRLKKGDVWSISQSLARKVAQGAGGGRIPKGPEIHNKDSNGKLKSGTYYYHYHIYNRTGGHSFY